MELIYNLFSLSLTIESTNFASIYNPFASLTLAEFVAPSPTSASFNTGCARAAQGDLYEQYQSRSASLNSVLNAAYLASATSAASSQCPTSSSRANIISPAYQTTMFSTANEIRNPSFILVTIVSVVLSVYFLIY